MTTFIKEAYLNYQMLQLENAFLLLLLQQSKRSRTSLASTRFGCVPAGLLKSKAAYAGELTQEMLL
jgi:hypothetical protein